MCELKNYKGTSNTKIDKCIRNLIKFLGENYTTVASCCGHNKYSLTVVVRYTMNGTHAYVELFSNTKIPRVRNFYKKDKEGYYHIPEVD